MNKIPIDLNIDDGAPRIAVYYEHHEPKTLSDGTPLLAKVPNSFFYEFCDTVEQYGIRGKLSVVPIPGGLGRIDGEIPGVCRSEITEWISALNSRLAGRFSFGPEMLTHKGYIDLKTMKMQDENEESWSFRQSCDSLTDYISFALTILKNAGIDPTGVTSPWRFGIKNEDTYAKAITRAFERVFGRRESWYFCRSFYLGDENENRDILPWVTEDEGRRTVAVPGTVHDYFWQSIDANDASPEYINFIADQYITADGKHGKIIEALDASLRIIIMTTHWQSLFSNGRKTGLSALRLVAKRVNEHLSGRVEWTSHEELMRKTLSQK